MFDGYIFTPGSLADVEVDGDVVGFERIDPSLIRPRSQPDHAVFVEVRLVEPLWDAQHDDQATVLQCDVFRSHRQWTVYQLAGGVADKLIGSGRSRSEERRVGKECRSRWSPYH